MNKLNVQQVQSNFPQILELAIEGEEIIITRDDKPVAILSPIKRPLKRGSAKGQRILMSLSCFVAENLALVHTKTHPNFQNKNKPVTFISKDLKAEKRDKMVL